MTRVRESGKQAIVAKNKNIRRSVAQAVFPSLGRWLITGLHASCRWTFEGRDSASDLLDSGRPFICATWHFCVLSILYHFRHSRGVVMVSRSRDAESLARLVERWGYATARGSKHKGGLDAARDMIEMVKREGRKAGLVADGSQGPARRAQKGAVFIARAARVPIVPAIVSARRRINLNSWDRTQIPLPFTELTMHFAPPIIVPPKNEGRPLETSRLELEDALNGLCRRAGQGED